MLELLHPVEGGAGLEPLDLRLVEGVIELYGLLATITVLYDCAQRLSWSKGLQSSDGDLVVRADLVVV